jgi:hypothetical protein
MLFRLATDHVALTLDPTRGGEIQTFARTGENNVLAYWDAPFPLSCDDGPGYGSTELDWLSRYRGGWQSLFPNAGAECVVDGVPIAFHGELSLGTMQVTSQSPTSIELLGFARLPLQLERRVTLADDHATVHVHETVTNLGAHDVAFVWGHHPTFTALPESVIDSPADLVIPEPATPGGLLPAPAPWPHTPRADGSGITDISIILEQPQLLVAYLPDLPEGWAALRYPHGGGVAMAWDLAAYPHMWMWLQNGDPGFPWYGRARQLGLEPQRAWPFDGLAGAIERGQALQLAAGQTTTSWLTVTLLPKQLGGRITGVSPSGAVRSDPDHTARE